jgi:nitrous oxidase accessory protein NosD
MTRSTRSLAVTIAALTFMLVAWTGAAQAHRGTVVGPGDSIQAAVDAAHHGDIIRVFGEHRENVVIQKDGLTLRGVGAVVLPPATPAAHACFDPAVPGERSRASV